MHAQFGVSRFVAVLVAAALALLATFTNTSPAYAAFDDSFGVETTNGSGEAAYLDYYNGNDDLIRIWDLAADGHGVTAYVWLDGTYLGSKWNGNGSGSQVFWDPFPSGEVLAGQNVGVKVCRGDVRYCDSFTWQSRDG